MESIIRKSFALESLVSWGAACTRREGSPHRAAPGGLNPVLRRLGMVLPSASQRTQLEMARRAVNQATERGQATSWLESRGLFWHRGQGSAQPAGACRAGRMGTQDGSWRAGSLTGREGPSGGGFSVTVASASLGDQSAFSVARGIPQFLH